MAISKETQIDSYDAMMDANSSLMTEIFNDSKLSAAEKLRNFSLGVRNQVALSRDLSARRRELMTYGMKVNANATKTLAFDPSEQAA